MSSSQEHSLIKVCVFNLIIDAKAYFKKNFIDSYKYYYLFCGLFFARNLFKLRDPRVKFLRNNTYITENLVKNHYLIRVKPYLNTKYSEMLKDKQNKNTINEVKLKHIPHFYMIRKHLFDEKPVENSKERQVEVEDHLRIKLSGVNNLSPEGTQFIEKLFNSRTKRFYMKFNNIQYMDEKEIYGWLLYKNSAFSNTYININVILVQNGYGELAPLKGDVTDERIYYYYSDLINADKLAKSRGVGIWRNQKSHIVAESSRWKGTGKYIHQFLEKVIKMKKWQKIVLNKRHDE